MLPVHVILAELYHAQPWTMEQLVELQQCLAVNARYCWDTLKLRQLSNMAAATEDAAWLSELHIREESLRLTGRAPTL
ncbi:DUF7667 family protein [Paenibacillus riograndensis]|uniref:Uncharacterized protein n=2 Tax=Paenibacillus riograndensis TaxID=483937 RepID=A0A0E4H787_9BACL|nr:hypothetical protein [Paenibacillus riograndensis]CQR51496.1 hypothetical protein PRIO_0242 [Paenibacillus riograndensis SBR5]